MVEGRVDRRPLGIHECEIIPLKCVVSGRCGRNGKLEEWSRVRTVTSGPVRVLHVVPSVSAGGIESLVVGLVEHIDRSAFSFDIAALNPTSPIHKDRLEAFGATVHFIADAGVHAGLYYKLRWRLKALQQFAELLRHDHYDVVHIHRGARHTWFTAIAAAYRVPVRVAHSHTTGTPSRLSRLTPLQTVLPVVRLDWLATHRIGCSDASTMFTWGPSAVRNGRATTIYNGVDRNRYSEASESLRRGATVSEAAEIQLLCVGRYAPVKNQAFAIEILRELLALGKPARLTIVGFGPLEEALRKKVRDESMGDVVRFLPRDSNIPELLRDSDGFLLPSLYEGMPVTAIEAQMSGVPVFASTRVTREIDMGIAYHLPLEAGPAEWARRIVEALATIPRLAQDTRVVEFDIARIALMWEYLYCTSRDNRAK